MDLEGGMYIGGLGPTSVPLPAALWSAVLNLGYVGCIRDFVMNGKALDVAEYASQQDSSKYMFIIVLAFQINRKTCQVKYRWHVYSQSNSQ